MGKFGSSLLTFLFSVPVTAVGFMAIFGVPQVTPLSASSSDDIVIRDPYDQNPWGQQQTSEQMAPQGQFQDAPPHHSLQGHNSLEGAPTWHQQNGTQPQPGNSRGFVPESPQPSSNPFGNRTAGNSAPTSSLGSPQEFPNQPASLEGRHALNTQPGAPSHNPFSDINSGRTNTTETSAQLLTWHQASARLAELGIQKYHLERGGQEGHFLFVCLYRPEHSPQVTHRFEAEGNDPLVATNQVISQIDNWIRKNYQENSSISGTRF